MMIKKGLVELRVTLKQIYLDRKENKKTGPIINKIKTRTATAHFISIELKYLPMKSTFLAGFICIYVSLR